MIQIPTPSINANKIAPTAADLTAADGPPSDVMRNSQFWRVSTVIDQQGQQLTISFKVT